MSNPIAPSLDHLRILTAIVDAGSFSATRRRGVQPWSLKYRAAKPPGPAGRLLM